MNTRLTLQEKLRDLRDERKLTLADLDKATGIPQTTLHRFETDKDARVGYQDLVTLIEFYGVSADYIFGLTDNRLHRNVAIDELGLTDAAVETIREHFDIADGDEHMKILQEAVVDEDEYSPTGGTWAWTRRLRTPCLRKSM
jgi:transcriptional regulator with XRE-family HTH domain